MPATFPKSERLSSKRAIAELFESGRGGFVYPFRYMVVERAADGPEIAVLVSVSKRNHKRAVTRNLLKRRTREAWRLSKSRLHAEGTLHIGLVYVSKTVEKYAVIEAAIRKITSKCGQSGA
ncbi:MAG: ribonuclease P protein component [Rikenellaceae bacterium]|jgi:ribonuclease P protein component|nr:ribonuclease P protein component [Rikenellaceae bacterium]